MKVQKDILDICKDNDFTFQLNFDPQAGFNYFIWGWAMEDPFHESTISTFSWDTICYDLLKQLTLMEEMGFGDHIPWTDEELKTEYDEIEDEAYHKKHTFVEVK